MDDLSIQEINDSTIQRAASESIITTIPDEHLSEDVKSEEAAQGHKRKASEMDASDNEENISASTEKRMSNDLSNEIYLKPFDLGWKREVVYKKNPTSRKRADIYYITPAGKKLRSKLEIKKYLDSSELTIDNFSLCQCPIGLNNSKKEIVRNAKEIIKISSDKADKVKPIVEIKLTPLIRIKKEKTKPKSSEENDTSTMSQCHFCQNYFAPSASSPKLPLDTTTDQIESNDFLCNKCKSAVDEKNVSPAIP